MLFVSGNASQHAVDKSLQTVKAFFLRQLYRLVADCGIRNPIHIDQLIDAAAEDLPYHRFHFFHFYAGEASDDIIHLQHILHSAFTDTGDKRPVLLWQILIFVQGISNRNMTVLSIPVDFQQNPQDDFSCAAYT